MNNTVAMRAPFLRWWGYLLLTTTLICFAISMRYFEVAHLDSSPNALLFRAVMLVAHFTLLSAVFLSPVLLIARLWPRPRYVITLGVTCASVIALALLVDTQVYQLYRFHINAGVMNLLFGGAVRETFVFPSVMYVEAIAIAFAVVAVVTLIAIVLWRAAARAQPRPTLARAVAALMILVVASFHLTHIWADAVAYEPLLEQTAVLPLPYAATAKRFLRNRGIEVRSRQALGPTRYSDTSALAYPLEPLVCRASEKQPNIVFVVIDSWRFDEMNAAVTPRIAEFAQSAMRFSDHYSGGNATRIGIFSMFYSIPGTYWHQILREQRSPVFIDELQRRRYDIQVFRSAPIFSPEFDRTVFANLPLSRVRSEGDSPAAWDRDLTNDFRAFLQARETKAEPFFALLFYDAPHSFEMPAGYPSRFEPSASHVNYLRLHADADPIPLLNRYRNSLHYVDGLVGEVLDDMRGRGLLENTVVIVTGDHGQEFNDTGKNYWGHGSNFSRYQTAVPMLMYVPGRDAGVVRHRTTHFDVVPTLLSEQLGCTSTFDSYSVGHSLFDSSQRYPLVLSEYTDFAIVHRNRIAVIRKHGMQLFTHDYADVEGGLTPDEARGALEQNTRFYKSSPEQTPSGGERRAFTSTLE